MMNTFCPRRRRLLQGLAALPLLPLVAGDASAAPRVPRVQAAALVSAPSFGGITRDSITQTAPMQATAPPPAASYRLDAAVDLARATVVVSQAVTVRNVVGVPLDTLVFRAVANSLGAQTLGAVTVDGQPVAPALSGSVLELPLPQPLAPGASVLVEMRFSLAVPPGDGRLSVTPRALVLGYWFPVLAVHRGDWDRRPFVDVGDATFSEVADFDLTVTTSTPAQVLATGERVEQAGLRWRFVAAGVRDVAVTISPEFVVRRATVGSTVLEVAAFGDERAAYYLTRGSEFLRWAGARLGPYPYPTLVVADADLPATFGGLEYPALILLSRAYTTGTNPEGSSLDSLYLHELLHQWFFSLVGNDQIADPWLDEAFVTYLTYRFYRETQPGAAAGVYDRTMAGGGSVPVDSGVYDFASDIPYFNVVYRRGARFLDALYGHLGDAAFWALLREHVATFRDRIASPRAFLEAARDRAVAASAAPLTPLIAEYFSYGAFRTATPRVWSVEAPAGVWSGSAALFVGAEFPVTRVQVWLDARRMADGPENALTLDLSDVEAGSYVLLVRVWDHDAVLFERARRIEVAR